MGALVLYLTGRIAADEVSAATHHLGSDRCRRARGPRGAERLAFFPRITGVQLMTVPGMPEMISANRRWRAERRAVYRRLMCETYSKAMTLSLSGVGLMTTPAALLRISSLVIAESIVDSRA